MSILKNIEDIEIERSIASPPDVGLGVSCIPLLDGFAVTRGFLTSKNVSAKVNKKDMKNNIMSYFICCSEFLYSVNTIFLEKFLLT